MAKFNRVNVVTVSTDVCDVEYRVRSLGRGRWLVREEDGYYRILRTAALQRFFRPEVYEDGYHSSGEPVRVYEQVYITRA